MNTDQLTQKAHSHLVTDDFVKKALPPLHPDSHKGQNGRLLLIASSPLFHGSGKLATRAAYEVETVFGSRTNDWLYYCSTKENIDFLKTRFDTFIGITRDQVEEYLKTSDVVVVGPGLMREEQSGFEETKDEPDETKRLTHLVLESNKKAVLDAGSLQVIHPEELQNHSQIIITPHLGEMVRLFGADMKNLQTSHSSSIEEIKKIADYVQSYAKKYTITILLKGPVDIIANSTHWYFSPGGDPALTRGGTGDVLAGITGALFTHVTNPIIAACAASYLMKRAGEYLTHKNESIFSATDIVNEAIREVAKISLT